jgi:hypothetical protein
MKACHACIHCYDGADGAKRCRVDSYGLRCSPALEAYCKQFVQAGDDHETPEWYRDAWHLDVPPCPFSDVEGRN